MLTITVLGCGGLFGTFAGFASVAAWFARAFLLILWKLGILWNLADSALIQNSGEFGSSPQLVLLVNQAGQRLQVPAAGTDFGCFRSIL